MKYLLLLLLLAPGALSAECRPVTGDRLLGRDLALADARFSALPETSSYGYAPQPGFPRVLSAPELQSIARAAGIKATGFSDICFEIPLHVPIDTEVLNSLRPALPPDASLRLLDMGRTPIPSGKMEFPLTGLEPPASTDSAQLWRGFVQYTDTRRAALWARVSISVAYQTVVARRDLAPDVPIDALALQLENKSGPLKRESTATKIEDVAGRVVIRPLKAGAEIPLSLLAEPPAVRRGDLVRVEVQSGRAVLHFDAIAETSARAGETADFRNPVTGKTFHARAEAGSKAVIVVGKGPA